MNKFLSFSFVCLFSFTALAEGRVCSNGGEGDNFRSFRDAEGDLEFEFWESSFYAQNQFLSYGHNSVTILGKDITFSGEGSTWTSEVTTFISYSDDRSNASVSMVINGTPVMESEEFNCK